jgi:hypothetical protein
VKRWVKSFATRSGKIGDIDAAYRRQWLADIARNFKIISLGVALGCKLGEEDGAALGEALGEAEGSALGEAIGLKDGNKQYMVHSSSSSPALTVVVYWTLRPKVNRSCKNCSA